MVIIRYLRIIFRRHSGPFRVVTNAQPATMQLLQSKFGGQHNVHLEQIKINTKYLVSSIFYLFENLFFTSKDQV